MAVSRVTYAEMVETLSSYLESLREKGETRVDVLPDTLALLALPRFQPRRPAPPPKKAAASRPTPIPRPVRSSAAVPLKQVLCRRLAICNDPPSRDNTEIRLVAAEPNFRGEAGELLLQMLTAIGYEPTARGTPFDENQTVEWNLSFGQEALLALHGKSSSLIMMRGQMHQGPRGNFLPTLAPVQVGDNRDSKKTVWADLQAFIGEMGLALPPKA